MVLREQVRPAEITSTYNTGLQTALVQCRDISILHKVKETPTLTMIEQAYGFKFASRVWVKAQIIEVNDFVGTKGKLSDLQLDQLSDQVVLEYGALNLLEFQCFCSRLRSGKYESFFGSVDPMKIIKSLDDFMEDRREDLHKAWIAEEKERKAAEDLEHAKNCISFEQYWNNLSDEQKSDPVNKKFYSIFSNKKNGVST